MSADRVARAAHAAEQLSAVLWEAVHENLSAGCPVAVAQLTDRIAQVCASVSAVAAAGAADGLPPPGSSALHQPFADGLGGSPAGVADGSLSGGDEARSRRGRDRDDAGGADEAGWGRGADPRGAEGIGGVRAELVDEHEGASTPIAIRDVRGAERTSWVEAVQRRLDRHAEDGERFAVLLLEVLDEERLRVAQPPAASHVQMRDMESAIVDQLRPADTLLRESDGRYWLIAPQTDAIAARLLAERIAVAARRSGGHRGAWPQIAAGIAICPEHGLDAAALIGHADVDLYAAQAAGRRVNGGEDGTSPRAG